MADITKCKGVGCPKKDSCYRFTAKESSYQSFFVDVSYNGDSCEMFWGIESEKVYNVLKDTLDERGKN